MATQLKLDSDTEQAIDELVGLGNFESREQLVREAVRLVRLREGFDPDVDGVQLRDDAIEAVERGIASANAGQFRPVTEVFADLRRRPPLGA